MSDVFLDETGYTGWRLADPAQPVFLLASHDIGDPEAADIKNRFFSRVGGRELKYSGLRRRPSQQEMVLQFMDYMKNNMGRTRIVYAHKPFTLICKAVDFIVEPVMARDGVNLYEQGGNLALANLIYCIVTSLGGNDYFERLTTSIQSFIAAPGEQSYRQLGDMLAQKIKESQDVHGEDNPLGGTLEHLYWPLCSMTAGDVTTLSKDCLDIAVTLALSTMGSWAKTKSNIALIHDESSNMAKQKAVWDAIVSPSVPPSIVGWDRRTMEYPIGVTQTRFTSSSESVGIQLADILCGAIGECLKSMAGVGNESDQFVGSLWQLVNGWDIAEHVWPEIKVTPEELGTVGRSYTDPIEHLGKLIDGVKESD